MSESKTTTAATARRSWGACIWLALCAAVAAMALSPAESSAQTVSAGEFSFASDVFFATEFDGVAVITVVRQNGRAGRVRVSYETVDDFNLTCGDTNSPAAVPDCDYTPAFGELIFDDFETTRRFMIGVMQDRVLSGTKALNIRLTAV